MIPGGAVPFKKPAGSSLPRPVYIGLYQCGHMYYHNEFRPRISARGIVTFTDLPAPGGIVLFIFDERCQQCRPPSQT